MTLSPIALVHGAAHRMNRVLQWVRYAGTDDAPYSKVTDEVDHIIAGDRPRYDGRRDDGWLRRRGP